LKLRDGAEEESDQAFQRIEVQNKIKFLQLGPVIKQQDTLLEIKHLGQHQSMIKVKVCLKGNQKSKNGEKKKKKKKKKKRKRKRKKRIQTSGFLSRSKALILLASRSCCFSASVVTTSPYVVAQEERRMRK